jgi:MoaA/NifB/PqqE/SkfB family radical SAM enzyme
MYVQPPTSFELEVTSRCNASCPQCARNDHGGAVWPSLPLKDLSLDWLQKHFSTDFLKNIKLIRLIGTYGEPAMHRDLIDIVRWLHASTDASIVISTNGSLRTKKWWRELGQTLRSQDRVIWSIDGLEDTNHLYRKDTKWSKIVENLQAFNQAGGQGVWSFIVFEHNEHQVDLARALSQTLGCAGFAVKPTVRFVGRQHQKLEQFPVVNRKQQVIHWLSPPRDSNYRNQNLKNYTDVVEEYGSYDQYLQQVDIKCDAQTKGYFQVSAQGYVFPCGWLLDRLYGFENMGHPSQQEMVDMIKRTGGFDAIDLNHTRLDDILNGSFFKAVAESWHSNDRLSRCANQCGVRSQGITTSWQDLNKVLPS